MVKALTCPSCGGAVSIKYSAQSLSCVCPSCLSVLSNDNESLQILIKTQKKMATPIIQLGGRYHFQGQDWEVIGYLLRSDKSEQYKWSEYLLFNPYVGYRFLVCMDGHWSYVIKTKSAPKVFEKLNKVSYLNKNYELFHLGKVKTLFVLGEFYWRVKANETVEAKDYIHPPEMLSLEKDSDEEIWSIGQYVDRRDVEKAFKLIGKMPLDIGVAPHQPSPHNEKKTITKFAINLIIILFLVHFAFVFFVFEREIFKFSQDVTSPKGAVLKTDVFAISNRIGYIHADLDATVNNDWFEVTAEVVNQETGEEYDFDQGVEFYSGSDSDGYWSEGSRYSSRRIAKLPPGNYYMNITTNSGLPVPLTFNLKLSEGNISWGNFIFALILLGLYPIYYIIRASGFEKSRWSHSDFSPYWSEND